MKKDKIIFWVTTGIVSLMMLFSAFNYLTNEEIKTAFIHLGFPSYFRIELAIAKILGALVLVLAIVPVSIRQFVYSGFAITFVSAFIAHLSSDDSISIAIMPIIFLLLLSVSYIYSQKLKVNR